MRGETKIYTQKEIDSKINILEDRLEKFLVIRRDTNQKVRRIREQIKEWKELDESQIKMF